MQSVLFINTAASGPRHSVYARNPLKGTKSSSKKITTRSIDSRLIKDSEIKRGVSGDVLKIIAVCSTCNYRSTLSHLHQARSSAHPKIYYLPRAGGRRNQNAFLTHQVRCSTLAHRYSFLDRELWYTLFPHTISDATDTKILDIIVCHSRLNIKISFTLKSRFDEKL